MKILIFTFLFGLLNNFVFAQDYFFIAAENGLIVRESPSVKSKKIGKLIFGKKVQLIERSSQSLTLWIDNEKNTARWYKVSSENLQGYVWSGYLANELVNSEKSLHENGYLIEFSTSNKKEYNDTPSFDLHIENRKTKTDCLNSNQLQIVSLNEIQVRLKNDSSFTVKKDKKDDQFYGYSFGWYYPDYNIYCAWESWLEAGHFIFINGENGSTTKVYGDEISSIKNSNIIVTYAADIGSGWTANGIQLLEVDSNKINVLLEIDPVLLLNENWGVVDTKWQNKSTLIVKTIMHNADSGYLTTYKKIHFEKLKK